MIIGVSVCGGYAYEAVLGMIDRRIYPIHYSEIVERASDDYGVPEEVIYAVIKVESNFRSDAVSHAGAVGLMQIIPETFDWLMLLRGETLGHEMLIDPETNIIYGTYLLAYLHDEFRTWETAFAAYNAGIGRVRRWLESGEHAENGSLGDVPIKETADYIVKVSDAVKAYKRLYG